MELIFYKLLLYYFEEENKPYTVKFLSEIGHRLRGKPNVIVLLSGLYIKATLNEFFPFPKNDVFPSIQQRSFLFQQMAIHPEAVNQSMYRNNGLSEDCSNRSQTTISHLLL